ncbi:plasma membrane Ca2+ ATPase [Plasmodium cynomolgi strain B]|uniref:Plasma membrane Ca2+ ATPase n=1 Tax=Plasmodium cynomolgi (strain B) TaxID=1120755 RepID=K6UE19_PLACD|nr:plasma membrane Ca2+ ATPase [Plasmodium cynomolgi strain B]GAB67581.1 plasma membrane Ca2+ ATPase [Plasmodium cynomolgi strain B]
MNNEITKSLFPYEAKFFKGIFDKYIKNEDYNEELKVVRSSKNLMEEVISKENGLNFYLDEHSDDTFLQQCKLEFFRKMLKYVYGRKEKDVPQGGSSSDVGWTGQSVDTVGEQKGKHVIEGIGNVKELHDYFVFNKKINVINSYRIYSYCSNIIQSLPSLTYFSVVKIYLANYPLSVFLSCVYFYTFVTYVCDRENLIEFLGSLFFSLIVTIGCVALTAVHYEKENRMNSIMSKMNNFKENYICRNFIKNKEKGKSKFAPFESKKTIEIKKYSKYFFLKSFLNRINAELFDYEVFKGDKHFSYVQENFKDIIPLGHSPENSEGDAKQGGELTPNGKTLEGKSANMSSVSANISGVTANTPRVSVEGVFPDRRRKTGSKLLSCEEQKDGHVEMNDEERRSKVAAKKKVLLSNESDGENNHSGDIQKVGKCEEGRRNSTEIAKEKKRNLLNYIIFENNIYTINSKNILVGDIVYLFKGDVIPADGILIKSNNMVVDESNILKSEKRWKKKISLDEYMYYYEKSKKRKISVNELRKKKLNYFEILNLKVRMTLKRFSREEGEPNVEIPKGEHNSDETPEGEEKKMDKLNQSGNEKGEENRGSKNNRLVTNFEKLFEYSPLVLSESTVREGTGIMLTTCVSKNKQMFQNTIKDMEESTELEDIINSFSKNVVIIIIFYCILCILFVFIHFLINMVENNMQTFAYNLLMFLLNCIILEILKYLLLSIDQMPLLLQNCIALNWRQIMRENFILKRKNTFEKILFTNMIYVDLERYTKYRCVFFFCNSDICFSTDWDAGADLKVDQKFVSLAKDQGKNTEISRSLFFKMLVQGILTTSNLYHYNENFLYIDLSLLKFLKGFEINDIAQLKEKAQQVQQQKHEEVICFAYKEIELSAKEREEFFQYEDDNDYTFDNKEMNNNMEETYLKYVEQNDYTCVSILVFEKMLRKHFYFDYKMLEANGMSVKVFTKDSMSKVKKLFFDFPHFFENFKLYNAKLVGEEEALDLHYQNEGDRFGNHPQGGDKKNAKDNLQTVEEKNWDGNDYNETSHGEGTNLGNYTLKKGNNKSLGPNKCRSEVLNLKECDDNVMINMTSQNEARKKKHDFLLSNNIFYNCENTELSRLLTISNYYGKNALATNESSVDCEEGSCSLRICDNRGRGESKEKSDIVILNKSLYDFVKLKNFSNCILTNILLFIEYNITLYVCLVIFSTVCTLVNGFEFLNTIQILYIYFVKNVIFHYLSCYRKSSICTVGKMKKQSYDFFKENDINSMICSILSKTVILFLVFFFGHVFIPESKWDFVSPDLRNLFEFSEFSYLTDREQSSYFYTIRSCIRFKKNLENLKIQHVIDVKNDYRSMAEWDTFISPGRHGTILFNIFFLFFFFSYIHIYLKSFLRDIYIYWEMYEGQQTNRFRNYIIPLVGSEREGKKDLSADVRQFMEELKEEGSQSTSLVNTKNVKNSGKGSKNQFENGQAGKNASRKIPPTEEANNGEKQFSILKIASQIISKSSLPNNNFNVMLLNLIWENYMTFIIFFCLLGVHIFVIEFGSFFFNLHVTGLTLLQWVFCFACCLLDFVLYFVTLRLGLFLLPASSFKTFQNLYEPRERSV